MKKLNVLLAVLFVSALVLAPSRTGKAAAEQVLTCSTFVINGEEWPEAVYDYVLLPDQTARIVKCRDASNFDAVPEALDGHAVAEIGEHAYSGGRPSIRLSIPDCVTTVCKNAFADVHTKLVLEVSATHPTLKEENGMLISPTEKRVIRGGFTDTLIIPEGIETVDDHAFWDCSVENVSIPASVKELGANPFAFCCSVPDTFDRLQSVELSPDNTALMISNGVLFSRTDRRIVWCFANPAPESYTIPDGTEIIDDLAFQRWRQTIFITIPASVTQVGINPFESRRTLEGIRIDAANRALILKNRMLISTADHRLVCAMWTPGVITVPAGIEIIGDHAFRVSDIRDRCIVTLPDSVTAIGSNAFAYAGRAEIHIPAGVRQIGEYAFAECTGIQELPEFNAGPSIGEAAFYGCTGITSLTVGGGKGTIGPNAFLHCTGLESMTLKEGVTEIGTKAFFMCESLSTVILPESLRSIGAAAFLNGRESVYEAFLDRNITQYRSTFHATVPSGSFAEQYCRQNDIDCSVR